MRALIVDDEPPARRRLARMLEALPGVEVVGEVEDGDALLASLGATRPDVVFLDVRMPGLDGLTLSRRHQGLPPVVFVTAYDEYAVRAFDVDAVDYLVKPVRAGRLAAAVERVRKRAAAGGAGPAATAPGRGLPGEGATPDGRGVLRVVSSSRGVLEVFDPGSITRFWASQKYTVFVGDGVERLTEESLSALEARLAGRGFLRVHRGELVRVDAVRALRQTGDSHEAVLSDGQRVRVSRRCLGALKEALGHLGRA